MSSNTMTENDVISFSESEQEAISAQTCYLPLFRTEPQKKSFGKKGSIRLSIPEIVWIVIMAFVAFWALVGIFWVPSIVIPRLFNQWLFGAVGAIPIGWQLGRKMAGASPYRQQTNEGMVQYLRVRLSKLTWLPSYIFNKPVVTNIYPSVVEDIDGAGNPIHVECVEWIGTMKAPYAPYSNSQLVADNTRNGIMDPNADAKYIFFLPQNYGIY